MQTILWTSDLARLWPIMADAAIKGAVVLAGAGFATGLLRAAPAALRHLIWAIALLLTLAMPGLSAMMPAWSVLPGWTAPAVMAPLPSTAIAPQEIQPALPALQDSESMPVGDAGAIESPPMPRLPTPPAPWSWRDWAALAWIIGTGLMLLPMTIAIVRLWRLRRRARPIEDSDWNDLLKKCARRLALRWPVTLLLYGGRAMPMTWGTIRPRVLLPRDARQWNADRREVVLLHELAHIKRWDCLTQLIAQLARAVYWFNPLAWLAAARTLVERESACDDLVLRLGAKPSDYAEELLAVATEFRAPRLCAAAGVAMARSPRLEGRVRAILDQTRNRKRLTILGSLLATSLLVGGVLPIAALRSAATADDQPATTTNDNATIPPKSDPWRATLANGIGVELVGVCDSPSAGKKWWRPDGSTLDAAPYDKISASVSPQSGMIVREFALRLTNVPKDNSVDDTWEFVSSRSTAGGGPLPDSDPNLRGIAVSLPDQSNTTVRFGIAAGAWRNVGEQDHPLELGGAAIGDADGDIIFRPVVEHNGAVIATVATDMTGTDARRVVAIGQDGTEHTSGLSSTARMGNLWQTTVTFNKLSLKDIRGIRLESRPYEWIEFKNVALHPSLAQSPSTATPQATGQTPLTGDLQALGEVAALSESNFQKLKTWEGDAAFECLDNSPAGGGRVVESSVVHFIYDRDHNWIRFRWPKSPAGFVEEGLVRDGKRWHIENVLGPDHLVVYLLKTQDNPPAAYDDVMCHDFYPWTYFSPFGPNPGNPPIAYWYWANNTPPLIGGSVRKDKALVIMDIGGLNRYEFDTAQGGNLTQYVDDLNHPARGQIQIQYENVNGVFVPSTYTNTDGPRGPFRWTFHNSKVNQHIPASKFTLADMGVKQGGRIYDQINGRTFKFDPNDDPP